MTLLGTTSTGRWASKTALCNGSRRVEFLRVRWRGQHDEICSAAARSKLLLDRAHRGAPRRAARQPIRIFVRPAVEGPVNRRRELCRIALEPGPSLLRQYLLARENGAGRIDADTQCQDPGVIHGAGDLGRALQTGTRSVSAVQYDKEEPWHGRSRSNLRFPAISERTNKRNGVGRSCLGAILTSPLPWPRYRLGMESP
jgi:hypothetical protein